MLSSLALFFSLQRKLDFETRTFVKKLNDWVCSSAVECLPNRQKALLMLIVLFLLWQPTQYKQLKKEKVYCGSSFWGGWRRHGSWSHCFCSQEVGRDENSAQLTVSFLVNLGLKVLEWWPLKVHLLEKFRVYQGDSINHYTVKGRKEERKWKKEGKKKYYWSLDSPVAAI